MATLGAMAHDELQSQLVADVALAADVETDRVQVRDGGSSLSSGPPFVLPQTDPRARVCR
eukprot:1719855-Pyramimonas_sp.AAC.1